MINRRQWLQAVVASGVAAAVPMTDPFASIDMLAVGKTNNLMDGLVSWSYLKDGQWYTYRSDGTKALWLPPVENWQSVGVWNRALTNDEIRQLYEQS